jgi:protein-S-isoprenylcysteine O-methyltransferase Ste14
MARFIRPSRTRSTVGLWAIAVLDTLLFFTMFMVALPWLSNWLLPYRVPLPFWPRAVAGAVLFVGGLALWAVCVDAFVRRGRGTPFPLEAPRQLVTTGPFAVVRNPLIAADAAVVWGEALFLSSLGVLLYATLFTLYWNYIVVRVEEPELRDRFGEQYEAYCCRVPRWFPAARTR